MAYNQLDRISSTDAGFLHQEGPNAHMHIGGLMIFDGPPPPTDQLMERVRSRLHLIPRYRQRLVDPPFGTGRPIWVDDTTFQLEYHVRPIALPAPGSFEDLLTLTGRLMSLRLDRAKPLWEVWLIGGLEPAAGSTTERFALFTKFHHSLTDGIAGVGIATVILDLPEGSEPISTEGLRPWHPRPAPTPAEMLLDGVRVSAAATVGLLGRTLQAALRPKHSVEQVREAAAGLGEIAWAMLNPAPETPLNLPIGPHRRYSVLTHSLADYKTIRHHFGATINDVYIAIVTGGIAHWLRSRGLRTEGVQLSALVPVSIRTEEDAGEAGNRLTVMRAPLPLYAEDPRSRIETVVREMEVVKTSKLSHGALTVVSFNEAAPPAVLAQTSRVQFSSRLFNLLVTNVPGPQFELRLLGRPAHDVYPLAFLSEHQALAIAIVSYNGKIEYGLLGDYDALEDLEVIGEGLELTLAETLQAVKDDVAAAAAAAATAAPVQPSPPGSDSGGQPVTPVEVAEPSATAKAAKPAEPNATAKAATPTKPAELTDPVAPDSTLASMLPTGATETSGPASALRAKRKQKK